MKINRKAKKVHPSPPQAAVSTTSAVAATQDSFSVLNLLPAAILTLVVALSFQDREVLAYMITRSLKTTTTGSINSSNQGELKLKRTYALHKPPVFDCECFECYTSFWFRWDSSPNREAIHQVIEAFEEHLASGELEMKRSSSNRRSKKKEKEKVSAPIPVVENEDVRIPAEQIAEIVTEKEVKVNVTAVVEDDDDAVVVRTTSTVEGHRGFARKVLPDVLGVFNSRLWNLWGPNV